MSYLGGIALVMVAATLTGSALHHVVTWRRFHADIAAQRVLPPVSVWPVAAGATLIELGLGAVLVSLAIGAVDGGALRRTAPLLSAALFAVYAAYSTVLVRFRPGVPCGCGSSARPVSLWTALRAAVLCGVSLAAVGASGLAEMTVAESAAVTALALVSAGAIWTVPDAFHVPGWRGTADKYAELRG